MLSSTPTVGASDGVSSIWNDDISMTWTRSGAGGASARMAVPMLPPICTSRPAARRMWAISAVVVDLPLVPVMATNGRIGTAARARSRQNSSMSPMISTPAASRLRNRPMRLRDGSAARRAPAPAPRNCSSRCAPDPRWECRLRRRLAGRPAHRPRRRPGTASQQRSAAATPERPRPNTATLSPANVVAGVMARLPGESATRRARLDAAQGWSAAARASAVSRWRGRPAPAPRK